MLTKSAAARLLKTSSLMPQPMPGRRRMFAGKTGASRAASTLLALSIPLLVCVHALLPLTLAGNQAQENPSPPYAIGLLDEHNADQNPKVLQKLATYTGGDAYFPNSFVEGMNVCR